VEPLILGGGQEMGRRSGTENVAGVVGFATALEIAEKKRKSEVKRLEELRQSLEKYLIYDIKNLKIHSGGKRQLPGILNFSVEGLDGERLVYALDQRGVCVATGSACAANKGTGSHVLRALGLPESDINSSLRVSLGRPTTVAEIEQFKQKLAEAVAAERSVR
jgi:cysteine desulfurase